MILEPDDYATMDLGGQEFTEDLKNARDFARRILLHLDIPLSECDGILYSTGDHGDPGKRVGLEDMWETRDKTRLELALARKGKEASRRRKKGR